MAYPVPHSALTVPAPERLRLLCDTLPPLLSRFTEEELSHRPAPGKWSKKEILGHLIDSAANNHQRFVRAQFEDTPHIVYDQEAWNRSSHYNDMTGSHLIAVWAVYNRHLVELIARLTPEALQRRCRTTGEPVTLQWLINDYVLHLEHHLQQIIPAS